MYNLQKTIKQQAFKTPTPQQLSEIRKTEQYLEKHRIHQICNELVAHLIESRPEKAKEQMINILKKIREKQRFLKRQDFENIFESYDIFEERGSNEIPYNLLIQALEKISIRYSKEDFLNKYPQFKLEKGVKKRDFTSIMENQYKTRVNFN